MIKIIAPPGCYGTYIARCLFHYTNLGFSLGWKMDFDLNGSSHVFRSIKTKHADKITNLHHDGAQHLTDTSDSVVVLADVDHRLDYYNNQFIKQEKGEILNHLLTSFTIDDIMKKLKNQWDYQGPLNEKIPRWIVREFTSFWLKHTWEDGYDNSKYMDLPHVKSFPCQDLFEKNYFEIISDLCGILNLDLLQTSDIVQHNHDIFLQAQRFHDIQIKCENFIKSCLDTDDCVVVKSPCMTIFDEAFVQYRLREMGWEIKCDGLDTFPDDSSKLQNLMYLS